MNPAVSFLGSLSRQGRLLLVAGLVAGMAVPQLATAMRPWLQELVVAMLFLAALRIGARNTLGALAFLPITALLALACQLVLPLVLLGLFNLAGIAGISLATALILMTAAPSIAGSPNLTIMTGHDPAPALRLLITGTAMLPLTVLPVLWLLPDLGDGRLVLLASARLFAVIVGATACGFLAHAWLLKIPKPRTVAAIDGVSAIVMAVMVIGLMSAVGPALIHSPGLFLNWLIVAFAANFGLQVVAATVLGRSRFANMTTPLSIIAGNRNIALFLVALPVSVTEPLLLFIGCYQIPMYLTPILLGRFYARYPDGPVS